MTVDEIIEKVKDICKKYGVSHLYLFGSYAKGTAHERSDIDFILKGTDKFDEIKDKMNEILTLKSIDLLDYDNIKDQILKESMDRYGKIIY